MDQPFDMTAQTFQGLESVLAEEIKSLGGQEVRIRKRAVTFKGDKTVLYRCNYCCRTAIDILVPVARGDVKNQDDLYELAQSVTWSDWFKVTKTFAIQTMGTTDELNNTMFSSLKVKDAIVDHFREISDQRPDVDKKWAKIRIVVRVGKDRSSISLSSSGEPLFKRGYRTQTGAAPMNEVMAAGLLKIAGYDGSQPFLDPMCGSGTLPIEAAWIASNTPAGYMRKYYAFHHWKNFDAPLWSKIQQEAMDQRKRISQPILGSDVMRKSVAISRSNAESAEMGDKIRFAMCSFEDRPEPNGLPLIITNPPYGERLGKHKIEKIYTGIRDKLKSEYGGCSAWIISSSKEGLKMLGMRPNQSIEMKNGGLDVEFCEYQIRPKTA